MTTTATTGSTSFDQTLANLGIKRSGTAASSTTGTGAKTTLDQSDFLALMTAQMKNQDPFNPVDNTQMVAQMAQFSSVAGISQMNSTLSAIATKLTGTSTTDAMSYIGKTVLVPGTTAYGRTSGGLTGAVELGAAAADVKVTIQDQNGATLKTLSMGPQAAGSFTYDWDGKLDSGADAPAGPYTVAVTATNAGVAVKSQSLVWAPVESVSVPTGGTASLTVSGLGSVDLSAVRSVG